MPNCDNNEFPSYNEQWTQHAIPLTAENQLAQCEMFEQIPNENETLLLMCPAEWFSSNKIKCDNWVFDKNERTIVNDVRI